MLDLKQLQPQAEALADHVASLNTATILNLLRPLGRQQKEAIERILGLQIVVVDRPAYFTSDRPILPQIKELLEQAQAQAAQRGLKTFDCIIPPDHPAAAFIIGQAMAIADPEKTVLTICIVDGVVMGVE